MAEIIVTPFDADRARKPGTVYHYRATRRFNRPCNVSKVTDEYVWCWMVGATGRLALWGDPLDVFDREYVREDSEALWLYENRDYHHFKKPGRKKR